MRLWHKDLIPYLPRQQLIAQWRECCAIAGSIAKKGTPNHLLVNKIMKFHAFHFWNYCSLVGEEFQKRGYNFSQKSFDNFKNNFFEGFKNDLYAMCAISISMDTNIPFEELFFNWHNERYLKQCLFNLQEKYDCGGIPDNEWKRIEEKFGELLK